MTTFLVIWISISAGITIGAKRYLGASWRRAIGGGFTWPTWPFLIAGSRIKYGRRRKTIA